MYIEPLYRLTRSYYREKKYRKRCSSYFNQVLQERKECITAVDNNCNKAQSSASYDEEMGQIHTHVEMREDTHLLDYLIMNEEIFTDEDIHDHVFTLVFTGFEKIALQTAFTIMLLAMHEESQEKVFSEIIEHVSMEKADITEKELKKLVYLESVILESLRLLPPVPLIARKTFEAFDLNGLVIPPGM
jgi:cytochrome P450